MESWGIDLSSLADQLSSGLEEAQKLVAESVENVSNIELLNLDEMAVQQEKEEEEQQDEEDEGYDAEEQLYHSVTVKTSTGRRGQEVEAAVKEKDKKSSTVKTKPTTEIKDKKKKKEDDGDADDADDDDDDEGEDAIEGARKQATGGEDSSDWAWDTPVKASSSTSRQHQSINGQQAVQTESPFFPTKEDLERGPRRNLPSVAAAAAGKESKKNRKARAAVQPGEGDSGEVVMSSSRDSHNHRQEQQQQQQDKSLRGTTNIDASRERSRSNSSSSNNSHNNNNNNNNTKKYSQRRVKQEKKMDFWGTGSSSSTSSSSSSSSLSSQPIAAGGAGMDVSMGMFDAELGISSSNDQHDEHDDALQQQQARTEAPSSSSALPDWEAVSTTFTDAFVALPQRLVAGIGNAAAAATSSFFEDVDEMDLSNDPIYQQVQKNKANPLPPGSSSSHAASPFMRNFVLFGATSANGAGENQYNNGSNGSSSNNSSSSIGSSSSSSTSSSSSQSDTGKEKAYSLLPVMVSDVGSANMPRSEYVLLVAKRFALFLWTSLSCLFSAICSAIMELVSAGGVSGGGTGEGGRSIVNRALSFLSSPNGLIILSSLLVLVSYLKFARAGTHVGGGR